ncbi:2-dehydro-3-deoxy-D-gluconate 5-dehydrogenase KduD [Gelria sp. Kuro-4]|uniref:2-dehydro-3-deoxy-D-gluconate 5-dehydrogenase KduD n=1 Tax=Gelria sp. Kuro-4 TaxID=2796927 RepID=UPI00351D4372
MLDQFRLDGNVALVTGAASGMGQAIAVALAEAGADVAAVGHARSLGETRARIEAIGHRCLALTADLTSIEPVHHLVDQTVDRLGRLDILVNAAGMIRRAPALDFSAKDWDDVMNLNLKTVFFLSQAAARVMKEHGYGKIINIASMLSFQGGILVPSYAASKGGVASLTKSLANEWAKYGINVNAIAPGYIDTTVTAPIKNDPVRNQAILERIPAGRWGVPTDVQGAAVYLASHASDYLQGTILTVDGGWLAR